MENQRPNILFLLTDQQRGDCIGIDGHPVLQTPNMDFLARSGARFRRAYSECPSCIPARRVLMSGQAPEVNGMVGMQSAPWHPAHTLAGELTQAGYQSEMIGKLHLYPHRKRYGFQHMLLADATHLQGDGSIRENDYLDWLNDGGAVPLERGIAHGASANSWIGRPSHLPEEQTHTSWCVREAMNFLEKRDPTAPFFLNVSFIDPHPPLTPPQWYYDRYIARDLPMPKVGDWAPHFPEPENGNDINASITRLDAEQMRCTLAAYYGLINHIDDQIGRLINYLMRKKLFDNTFILFTSDHGDMLGDHNMFRKTVPYEGSARVPFFARAPRGWEYSGEVVTDAPVGLQDVMPTLLETAGVPIPGTMTGRSVLPLMRGEETGWREYLHGEHAGAYRYEDGMHFLVGRCWKYIWFSQTGREQLFDLCNDPHELHDLAQDKDSSARLECWRARLAKELKNRPEGFSDGRQLFAGKPHKNLVPGVG